MSILTYIFGWPLLAALALPVVVEAVKAVPRIRTPRKTFDPHRAVEPAAVAGEPDQGAGLRGHPDLVRERGEDVKKLLERYPQ